MRPDMTDQLAGVRRILTDIIAPELREGYPSQVLRGVVKNLTMLEAAWPKITSFLEWDIEQTEALLHEMTPFLADTTKSRVVDCLNGGSDVRSVEELDRRNAEVRQALADAIPQLLQRDDAAPVVARVKEHLMLRMSRYPFRMAISTPTSAKAN